MKLISMATTDEHLANPGKVTFLSLRSDSESDFWMENQK